MTTTMFRIGCPLARLNRTAHTLAAQLRTCGFICLLRYALHVFQIPSNRASGETVSTWAAAFFFLFSDLVEFVLVALLSAVKRAEERSLNTCEAVE